MIIFMYMCVCLNFDAKLIEIYSGRADELDVMEVVRVCFQYKWKLDP